MQLERVVEALQSQPWNSEVGPQHMTAYKYISTLAQEIANIAQAEVRGPVHAKKLASADQRYTREGAKGDQVVSTGTLALEHCSCMHASLMATLGKNFCLVPGLNPGIQPCCHMPQCTEQVHALSACRIA